VHKLAPWPVLAAAVYGGGRALDAAGLPSSYLFAALLIGLAVALVRPGLVDVPAGAFRAGQAVAGVSLGAYLQSDALSSLADSWLPVLVVSAATLGLSIGAGAVLTRTTPVDPPTAALGLIAGGASGIVGMSDELGADDRLVAFMQYLRVLVVVVLTPLLIAVLFPGHHAATGGGGGAGSAPLLGDVRDWALTLGLAAGGALAAGAVRLTAGALLGPMVLTGIVVLAIPGGSFTVPTLVSQTAFSIIGLQVGLRFTTETIRLLGRLLVPVLLSIAGLLVACFGLAELLNVTTSVSLLDGYLATTPGGLYAVLAVAFGSGANTTFVIGVQSLRVLVMVLLAPVAVRWTLRGRPRVTQPAGAGARWPGSGP
jgi:membrane AbrB-like protein